MSYNAIYYHPPLQLIAHLLRTRRDDGCCGRGATSCRAEMSRETPRRRTFVARRSRGRAPPGPPPWSRAGRSAPPRFFPNSVRPGSCAPSDRRRARRRACAPTRAAPRARAARRARHGARSTARQRRRRRRTPSHCCRAEACWRRGRAPPCAPRRSRFPRAPRAARERRQEDG